MTAVDRVALVEAVRQASGGGTPSDVEAALTALIEAHDQEVVAKQQTAFLIGMEVGRAAAGRLRPSTAGSSGYAAGTRS